MPKVTVLVPNVKEGGESYNRSGRMSALYQKYAKKCAGTEGVVTSVVMPTIAAREEILPEKLLPDSSGARMTVDLYILGVANAKMTPMTPAVHE